MNDKDRRENNASEMDKDGNNQKEEEKKSQIGALSRVDGVESMQLGRN